MEPINKEVRKKALIKAWIFSLFPLLVGIIGTGTYAGLVDKSQTIIKEELTQLRDSLDAFNKKEVQFKKVLSTYKDVMAISKSSDFGDASQQAMSNIKKIDFKGDDLFSNTKKILIKHIEKINNSDNDNINEQSLDSLLVLYQNLISIQNENDFLAQKVNTLGKMGVVSFLNFPIGDSIKETFITSVTNKQFGFEKDKKHEQEMQRKEEEIIRLNTMTDCPTEWKNIIRNLKNRIDPKITTTEQIRGVDRNRQKKDAYKNFLTNTVKTELNLALQISN